MLIQTFSSLFLGDTVEPDEVEDVVNQVVERKMNRCLRLDTFRVETVGEGGVSTERGYDPQY